METPLSGYLTPRAIEALAALLGGGGIAVLPTDTIYGFHCSAADAAAVERIRRLKGRRAGGFIILACSLEMAARFVSRWPGRSRETLGHLWPGPVTALLPAARAVPAPLRPRGIVAIRIPDHEELARLIRRVGEPLVSTSVNRSGEKPLLRIGEIRRNFPGLGAYIGRRGRGARSASTVVDFTRAEPRIVREGARARRVMAALR